MHDKSLLLSGAKWSCQQCRKSASSHPLSAPCQTAAVAFKCAGVPSILPILISVALDEDVINSVAACGTVVMRAVPVLALTAGADVKKRDDAARGLGARVIARTSNRGQIVLY